MQNAIELQGLKKRLGNFVLGPIDLIVPRGCIVGYIGENGAGKSTTIKLLLNLMIPDQGEIKLLGKNIREFTPQMKKDIAYVFDDLYLPEDMTLKNVQNFHRKFYGHMFIVGFLTVRQGNVTILPLMFILVPLILLGMLWGSDTKSNVNQYIIPGPVTRKTIVLSRYVFVWIVAVIGTLFTILLKLFLKDGILLEIPWYLIAVTMPLLITIISVIQLPLMYKFGAEKTRLSCS